MLKYCSLSIVLYLVAVAAHAQCSGLSAFTESNGRFIEGMQPNAADLNRMQATLRKALQSSFLPLSGGTITGALISAPSGTPSAIGDNVATLDLKGGRINLLKQILSSVTNTPVMVVQLDNSSSQPLASYGIYPQIGAVQIQANGHASGTASLDAAIFTLNLYGNHPYQAQDVAVQSTVNQYGSDSSWLFDGFSRDLTGKPPSDFSQVGIELDMSANGPDQVTSSYDPLHNYRLFLSLNPGVLSWPSWQPERVYAAGSIIMQKDAAGVMELYIAQTAGRTARTKPSFPSNGVVIDGAVRWAYSEPYAVEYGRGIWLDSGQAGANVSFGSGFASNALFQDAPIDISEASLASSTAAGIRLAANMPIDFTGNGAALGQNVHIIQYSDRAAALTYTVKGTVALAISDTGLASFPGQIQAPLATPKSSSSPCVTGTRTADTNYEYVCVATNTWKRAALSAF